MTRTQIVHQSCVPSGEIGLGDFSFAEAELQAPGEGEVLIRVLYISVDPYLVMRIRAGDFPEGRVRSRLIGRIEVSRAPGFVADDLVLGFGRWQEHEVMPAAELRIIRPVAPLPAYLGVVGHSGYTALLGIELLGIAPGQTFTVSSAAGMVGAVAGQLAKLAGARVIGIAGGDKAAAVVDKLGFDAGIDYRQQDLAIALAAAAPRGIDRHFENVGAPMLDPVLGLINQNARIALCGLIAHYSDEAPICLANFRRILMRGATISAFSIYDHLDQYEKGLARLEKLVIDGRLRSYETIAEGFASLPGALIAMLRGEGFGKHMVRLAAH